MSLPGFDSLRRNHPEAIVTVDRLEEQITATLRQDRHAVIDHLILAQLVNARRDAVGRLLAELVKLSALSVRWFWICPNTHGTVIEADSEAEFPDVIECSKCGEEHYYDIDDTEVEFVPTDALLRAAAIPQR
jgi:hypothetical protein